MGSNKNTRFARILEWGAEILDWITDICEFFVLLDILEDV